MLAAAIVCAMRHCLCNVPLSVQCSYNNITFAESFGDLAFTTYSHAVGLRDLGMTMAPLHAWLTLTAIETLPLRM
jgi:O-acetylhomoserine/O-acetylserine sulfhydrylase-like pyridoxal-dependent enzyme